MTILSGGPKCFSGLMDERAGVGPSYMCHIILIKLELLYYNELTYEYNGTNSLTLFNINIPLSKDAVGPNKHGFISPAIPVTTIRSPIHLVILYIPLQLFTIIVIYSHCISTKSQTLLFFLGSTCFSSSSWSMTFVDLLK
jgi:hypothetical protein